MATRKTTKPITKAVATDTPERFKLSETGFVGLSVFGGVTTEEIKRELNFPYSIKTYKQMSYHSAINSALTLFENIINKATWEFKPPANATAAELEQCKIIASMMQDMEGSWTEFIRDVLSSNVFGFAVHEKVYRKRYKSNGSMFNDGYIGWKKLPLRSQETIEKFIFSANGNEIEGVKQNLSNVSDPYNRYSARTENTVVLPRSKFMLFRTGKHRGDPFGKSPLRDAYLAWRFLTSLEELEAVGIAKDLNGLPVLSIPAQYLSADASPDQKAIKSYYENCMRNLQMNNQAAMVLPSAYDPDTKQQMFKLELLSNSGQKSFDISKVKEYYKNLIFTSMAADILIMGQGSTGSFALGSIKNSLSASHAENLLSNITEVLNNDLIRQTYELNNWPTDRMGKFDFDGIEPTDLETFSKAVQRMGATGYIPKNLEVINTVLDSLGIDKLPEGTVVEDLLPDATTRAGDGMAAESGGLNGTSSSVTGNDNSISNMENA